MAPTLLLAILSIAAVPPGPTPGDTPPPNPAVGASVEVVRGAPRSDRAKRPEPASLRRRVRKRDPGSPTSLRAAVERPDLSVVTLAEILDTAVSTLRRGHRHAAHCIPTWRRLLNAGSRASLLHLPPPGALL